MCFLKVFSETKSFKSFSQITSIPVYSVHNKGERRNKTKIYDDNRISFDVSDRDWDDFPGQVNDVIIFLKNNYKELKKMLSEYDVKNAFLDFPLYSRLTDEIVNQNDHLPKELVVLAGKLNLGIEMAIYSVDAFNDEDD